MEATKVIKDNGDAIKTAKECYERWKSIKQAMETYKEDVKEIAKEAAEALRTKPATINKVFGKMYKDKKDDLYDEVKVLEDLIS
jgi:hypothetical protein